MVVEVGDDLPDERIGRIANPSYRDEVVIQYAAPLAPLGSVLRTVCRGRSREARRGPVRRRGSRRATGVGSRGDPDGEGDPGPPGVATPPTWRLTAGRAAT